MQSKRDIEICKMNLEKKNHSFNSSIRGNAKTDLWHVENINGKHTKRLPKRNEYHDNYSSGTTIF